MRGESPHAADTFAGTIPARFPQSRAHKWPSQSRARRDSWPVHWCHSSRGFETTCGRFRSTIPRTSSVTAVRIVHGFEPLADDIDFLGAEAARLGKSVTTKVYSDTGPEDERGHCFGGARGMHVWAEDAKAFLSANVR